MIGPNDVHVDASEIGGDTCTMTGGDCSNNCVICIPAATDAGSQDASSGDNGDSSVEGW